jgi:hypothetical protein
MQLITLKEMGRMLNCSELIIPGKQPTDPLVCMTHNDQTKLPCGWIVGVSVGDEESYLGLNGMLRVFKTLGAVHKALLGIGVERFIVYTVY